MKLLSIQHSIQHFVKSVLAIVSALFKILMDPETDRINSSVLNDTGITKKDNKQNTNSVHILCNKTRMIHA